MQEKDLLASQFVTIHKAFSVNKEYLKHYHSKTFSVEITVFDEVYKTKSRHLPVSENYRAVIRKIFSKPL